MAAEDIVKVAHVAVVTPHQAGLYETTRDLVEAERKLGIDARISDPTKNAQGIDRNVPIIPNFVAESDIVINHSGLSAAMRKARKPIIHVMHGRPYSSFLLEQAGKVPVYSFWKKISRDPSYKVFVTFWPEFVPYFSMILPSEKIHVVPPPVDLERWTPDGPCGYSFHECSGEVNVVVTDIWRRDKDPYHVINAFFLFARQVEGAKLHVYAAPQKGAGWQILKSLLEERGIAGEIVGFVKGLDNVYRAADMLITPQRIATRSVREALACGCQVVMAPGNSYTPYQADPEDIEDFANAMLAAYSEGNSVRKGNKKRRANRKIAIAYFDSANTARKFVELIREVHDGSR